VGSDVTNASLYDIRRELVSTSFRHLGDGVSSFAIEHLHELVNDHRDIGDLRMAVASLAVRGGLSDRESSDENITELLDQLAIGKAKAAGTSRLRKSVVSISPEDQDFVPSAWRWVPLADITAMYNGFAFKSHAWKSSGLPIVRIQNLNRPHAAFNFTDASAVPERNRIGALLR
jgi:type I restriction enzyme S subunit